MSAAGDDQIACDLRSVIGRIEDSELKAGSPQIRYYILFLLWAALNLLVGPPAETVREIVGSNLDLIIR